MIRLDDAHQATLDAYLAGPVVRAELRVESWLGDRPLGSLPVGAGTLRWDGSEMCGLLDVDVQVDGMAGLSPEHPVGPYGQILRASWHWPEIGMSMPVGHWRVDMPERKTPHWWSVRADPAGIARLLRQRWLTPPSIMVSGTASSQIGKMCAEAGVAWVPDASWTEDALAPTECKIGDTVLKTLHTVLDQSGATLIPGRDSSAVIVGRPRMGETPDWTVETQNIEASIDSDAWANMVTVWYEVPGADGADPTYVSYTDRLMGGPRAVSGPMGPMPAEPVKLDGSVSAPELRRIARDRLREAQLSSASVTVTTRADPRREVGDLFRALSYPDEIDCLCRCTGITIDTADGSSKIEGAVIYGTINGVTSSFTDLAL